MENKKEWIDFLLKKSKFELTEEEKDRFEKDLELFIEQLKIMDEFDLENVKPMVTPFNKSENTLRQDSIVEVNDNKTILENASKEKEGYIFLEKEED